MKRLLMILFILVLTVFSISIVSCGSDSEFQYVVSGVSKGQKVISAGTHKVMIDGMPVQILTPARK